MPTLHGEIPRNIGDAPFRPCVWCKAPTDISFIPEGLPDLGPQPMHLLCAADLIRAYQAWRAGRTLSARHEKRLAGMQRLALGG